MKEIPRIKRLEVARCYLLGYTYREIEKETGVSHGSIANIITEIESSEFVIAGTTIDQVNDFRQLSLELKKGGLKPSQALLGISYFKRMRTLEITPEDLEVWTRLVKELRPADFPVREFFEEAKRLHELEVTQGRPFETLAEEYTKYQADIEKLKDEIDSLSKNKSKLSDQIQRLSPQLNTLEKQKGKLDNDIALQTDRVQKLESKVKEAKEENTTLQRETKELQMRRTKLSSEIAAKEELLVRLKEIGFSEEDLIRLRSFIERISQDRNINVSQVKEDFFSALALFKNISSLEHRKEVEAEDIRQLAKEKSILSGEIKELENRKGKLLGEIDMSIISTSLKLKTIQDEAISQLHKQLDSMRNQMDILVTDSIKTGEAVSQMRRMVKEGKQSEKNLKDFLSEARIRLEGNRS